jgi:hypothetical protein
MQPKQPYGGAANPLPRTYARASRKGPRS